MGEHPWLNRWGRGRPNATFDIFERLDNRTKDEILECAKSNSIKFEEEGLTERNRQVYAILGHIGKLGLALLSLVNAGLNASELANEFGKTPEEMKGVLRELGVDRSFRAKRKSSDAFSTLIQLLDDMGVRYEAGRRITYTHNGRRYSAFPTFFLLEFNILLFIKDSACMEKSGRQDSGLKEKGFRVLRFLPNEVRQELTRVTFDIETAIQSVKLAQDEKNGKTVPFVIAMPKSGQALDNLVDELDSKK